MHIAIDCRFWGPVSTGLGRYTQNLVLGLKNLNNDTKYTLIIDPENAPVISELDERFKLIPLHVRHHTVKEQLSMTVLMLRLKVDLFHFPHYIVPIINGHRPFVVTIHDIIKHKFPTRAASTLPPLSFALKYQFYKLTVRNAIKDSRHIIVDSNHVKNDLTSWFCASPQKISVIPLAADDRFTERIDPGKYSYPFPPKSFILVVGNAYPYKNVETIIEALKFMPDHIQMVLVGARDVFVERLLNSALDHKVNNRVHLLGFVDDTTLSYLYQTALAYVSASLEEGFGIQPLEAMRSGCPVVVSDIPPFREVCADSALYFDPNDPKSLAEILILLNNESLTNSLLNKGLTREKEYTWLVTAQNTHKVYEQVFSNI